jgi:hypothetical protein
MPLFITPMTKAPMTTSITLPTPPEAEAPPMKQAAQTVYDIVRGQALSGGRRG